MTYKPGTNYQTIEELTMKCHTYNLKQIRKLQFPLARRPKGFCYFKIDWCDFLQDVTFWLKWLALRAVYKVINPELELYVK